MFELVKALNQGAASLNQNSANPISLNAGCERFIAFVTLFPHDSTPSVNLLRLKMELVRQGETYVSQALTYRRKIGELAVDFIKDDSILTHSYSRVVMETLLLAHKRSKRISGQGYPMCAHRVELTPFAIFVTEARPRGLGVKTAEALTAVGIPCTVILDSAVAYGMEKVDFVLVGSEAVVESGGLINAIGPLNIAIIAKAANKPLYALAESYKFHRLFPLSQYDLPSHNSRSLSFPTPIEKDYAMENATENISSSASPSSRSNSGASSSVITQEEIAKNNPDVDYTRPDLISLVFSELGSLTPSGKSIVCLTSFR
ncbi:hypothetical protein DFH06DRAFT_1407290 [Mycena polygramma]|nr:hypothetical protein DFH06DRAFT_1407290 [Mycena polygramma]